MVQRDFYRIIRGVVLHEKKKDVVMLNLSEQAVAETRLPKPDANAFRVLIAMSVLCFLIVAVISRLLPRSLRPLGVGHASESCLQEARRTAHTVIPYAFMR